MKILQPPCWAPPRGYVNGISTRGRIIFTAGVVGWNRNCEFTEKTLSGQFYVCLRNIRDILHVDGARPEHIVRMTCYVTSIDDYLEQQKELREAWKLVLGDHYPAMALVEVRRLVDKDARVEIEATAVVEDE